MEQVFNLLGQLEKLLHGAGNETGKVKTTYVPFLFSLFDAADCYAQSLIAANQQTAYGLTGTYPLVTAILGINASVVITPCG